MATVTETVVTWSVASDMQAPHSLDEVLLLLNEARLSIPAEYRSVAEIDFDPYFDCAGDYYPQVSVTYERPETEEEAALRLENERAHWGDQMKAATDRVAFCLAQIDALRDGEAE
jgi:hypothetical protein